MESKARLLAALGNPAQLQIVYALRNGEKCVHDITKQVGIIQPIVSRHLKTLMDAGAVKYRREGNKHFYGIADKRVLLILDDVDASV